MPPKAQPFHWRPVTSWNAERRPVSVYESNLGEESMQRILTSGGDFLAGGSDTDDDTLAPSLLAGFKSSTHDTNVASAVESVVTPAVCHLDELLLDALVTELGRVDEVGSPELLAPFFLGVIHIDVNNHRGLVLNSTLDHGKSDTSGTENSDTGVGLNISGHNGGTVTGGDTAS